MQIQFGPKLLNECLDKWKVSCLYAMLMVGIVPALGIGAVIRPNIPVCTDNEWHHQMLQPASGTIVRMRSVCQRNRLIIYHGYHGSTNCVSTESSNYLP